MPNPFFEVYDLSVCTVCIHLIANGEYNDGEDSAEVCARGQRKLWGRDVRHLCAGGAHQDECTEDDRDSGDCDCDNHGFSWSSCDGCGGNLGGDRHGATALIPRTLSKAQSAILRALVDVTSERNVFDPHVRVRGHLRRSARVLARMGLVRFYPSGRVDLLND